MPACTGLWALLPVPVAQPVLTLDESSLLCAQDLSLVATAPPPPQAEKIAPGPPQPNLWASLAPWSRWRELEEPGPQLEEKPGEQLTFWAENGGISQTLEKGSDNKHQSRIWSYSGFIIVL